MNKPKAAEIPAIANQFAIDLESVLLEVKNMLLEKNRKYGDAALSPMRVFSKAPVDEQIRVRLDDKVSRLASGQLDDDEDVIKDMLGYLIILRMAKRREESIDSASTGFIPPIVERKNINHVAGISSNNDYP